MKIEDNKNYYNKDLSHSYMDSEEYDAIVYDYVKRMNLQNQVVLEIGSGFGRYTTLLAENCRNVCATEPNPFMCEKLNELRNKYPNVSVLEGDLEKISSAGDLNPDYVFLFHVLHHLNQDEIEVLKEMMKKIPAKYFFLEPNHLNPLFFIQVMITKNMRLSEERGMFRDNSARLIKSFSAQSSYRRYLGILPRGITNKLSKSFRFFSNSSRFICKFKNPFSAYSVLIIDSKKF